jgi:putative transposase
VPQPVRDEVVDFVTKWMGISPSKYYDWRERYGQANEHNGQIPRRFWLQEWERKAIIDFYREHPEAGYRRLTYMMIDADIVAASPSSVYRVLKQAKLLRRWAQTPSSKGQGFQQPERPHQHWHIDVAYINICGTFYYLCSILDGYSRYLVHWEIRERMTEADVEIILQRALDQNPQGPATDHLGQWAAVRGQGLQVVHPAMRYDPCAYQPVLSSKQRQD